VLACLPFSPVKSWNYFIRRMRLLRENLCAPRIDWRSMAVLMVGSTLTDLGRRHLGQHEPRSGIIA
jgi:hypothetical protein